MSASWAPWRTPAEYRCGNAHLPRHPRSLCYHSRTGCMPPPPPCERNHSAQPFAAKSRSRPQRRQNRRQSKGSRPRLGKMSRDRKSVARDLGSLSTKSEVLLADEAPIWEMDDLRQLIAEGQERGSLTFEQIAAALEEVEVTKEQVQELHQHLDEQGIDVVGADGKP